MKFRILTLLLAFGFSFFTAAAQDGIDSYTGRNTFDRAVSGTSIFDFEGIVPETGFRHYQREGSLRYSGLEFRPGGGGKFGPGPVVVVGTRYQAGSAYETTTGAKLHWSPPNQPGNAYLDVRLPGGTTAVATDLWTVGPRLASVDVTVTTANGETRTESVATPRPGSGFIGFTSSSPIVSLRFTPPKGQTGLILDNVTTAKSNGRRSGNNVSGIESPRREEPRAVPAGDPSVKMPRPESTSISPNPGTVQKNAPAEPRGAANRIEIQRSGGPIAYVRGDTEIRLINPDGTNDHQLWTHKDLHPGLGVFEMAWKPDGTELAFSSAHEAAFSLFLADLFTIHPDGSGLRRLTNPPDRAGFARFPKGSVTVTVRNDQGSNSSSGSFLVYIAGADEPQLVALPPGSAKTIVFKSVADFGKHPQPVIAMYGEDRWFVPGVDVLAGRNVIAPAFNIVGQGFKNFGAFRPVWRQDGSRISYRSGMCVLSSVSSNPVVGEQKFDPLFSGENPFGTCTWDLGRTAANANQVIYTANSSPGGSNIYQMAEGGKHPGTKLTQFSEVDLQVLYDLRWLPDGSGFLYSAVNEFRESSNIYRFDLATRRATQLTKFDREFARAFSISPDGGSVVFEKCASADEGNDCDLWITGANGAGAHLLIKNGQRPAWGK